MNIHTHSRYAYNSRAVHFHFYSAVFCCCFLSLGEKQWQLYELQIKYNSKKDAIFPDMKKRVKRGEKKNGRRAQRELKKNIKSARSARQHNSVYLDPWLSRRQYKVMTHCVYVRSSSASLILGFPAFYLFSFSFFSFPRLSQSHVLYGHATRGHTLNKQTHSKKKCKFCSRVFVSCA